MKYGYLTVSEGLVFSNEKHFDEAAFLVEGDLGNNVSALENQETEANRDLKYVFATTSLAADRKPTDSITTTDQELTTADMEVIKNFVKTLEEK